MKYFVPSKTFLTGEYSVLVGGSALGLATDPSFEISYLSDQIPFQFHESSPAGLFLRKKNKTANVHIHDPYLSKGVQGGFGKSTAEYFAALIPFLKIEKKTPTQIHSDYLSLFAHQKVKPSGVDLLIQYIGQVAVVDQKQQKYRSTLWKFEKLSFFILSTGLKVQTHEHLENLDLTKLTNLPILSDQVIDAYLNKTQDDFLLLLKKWSIALKDLGLLHKDAESLQNEILKIKNVKHVKPCGALGADVMLVFCDQENSAEVEAALRKQKYKVQGSEKNLTEGLIAYVG